MFGVGVGVGLGVAVGRGVLVGLPMTIPQRPWQTIQQCPPSEGSGVADGNIRYSIHQTSFIQ